MAEVQAVSGAFPYARGYGGGCGRRGWVPSVAGCAAIGATAGRMIRTSSTGLVTLFVYDARIGIGEKGVSNFTLTYELRGERAVHGAEVPMSRLQSRALRV